MTSYEPKTFNIPALDGISAQTIEEHMGLYKGYVKHVNLIHEKIEEYSHDSEKHAYALGEIQRRLGFEFDGMRNHEYYFALLEGGHTELRDESSLKQALAKQFGSFDAWFTLFKSVAKTRGIGWAILYYDPKTNQLLNTWVDEQHLGHLMSLSPILTLDMWEHSYMLDYPPSKKAEYIEAFFRNVNWEVAEKWFEEVKEAPSIAKA